MSVGIDGIGDEMFLPYQFINFSEIFIIIEKHEAGERKKGNRDGYHWIDVNMISDITERFISSINIDTI
jgi:hypothetical protein